MTGTGDPLAGHVTPDRGEAVAAPGRSRTGVATPGTGRARAGPAWWYLAMIACAASVVAAAGGLVGALGDEAGAVVGAALVLVLAASMSLLVRASRGDGGTAAVVPSLLALSAVVAVVGHGAGGAVATVAAFALLAIAHHLLVAQPDGRTDAAGRRAAVVGGDVAAVGAAAAGVAFPEVRWWLAAAVGAGLFVASYPPAAARSRRSGSGERRRLLAVLVVVCGYAELAALLGLSRLALRWPGDALVVLGAAALAAPLLVVVLLGRRRHVDLAALARRTVATLVVTLVAGGVCAAIIVSLVGVPDAHDRGVVLSTFGAVAVALAVAAPAIRWSDRVAGRVVSDAGTGPAEALRSFPARMTRAVPMDELLQQLVELCRRTFHLASAEVWRADGERLALAASVPHASRPPVVVTAAELPALTRSGVAGGSFVELWLPGLLRGRSAGSELRVAPVLHAGQLLGLIVLEQEPGASPLRGADDALLTELARQVGLALHNVELDHALQASLRELQRANDDLQASRARIVATADAERRSIERNLHDGAQQHLVALAVNLRLARDVVASDPKAGAELLAMLADSVKDAIEELRTLAHGIYPPLLVDSGLGEALRAAAARSPLDVELSCDGVGRHGPEVEAAIYFCCLEALQNASKHAPGANVAVHVEERDDRLRFEVRDDGPGFDPSVARTGHGHVNMSDRLGAIGGQVQWDSSPGRGTRISGWVPLAERAPTGP